MRGVPGVPSNRSVPAFDRAWIATVLTLQLVGGRMMVIEIFSRGTAPRHRPTPRTPTISFGTS
jgi:hypothetical protein